MVRSQTYIVLIALLFGFLFGLVLWAHNASEKFITGELNARQQLVSSLSLTDLAIWTEARYTRHPAMADLFSPFQDYPAAFEHFPAGGLMPPSGSRPDSVLHLITTGQP